MTKNKSKKNFTETKLTWVSEKDPHLLPFLPVPMILEQVELLCKGF